MGSLNETIDQTLTNIGREPRDLLLETLESFWHLELSDEEQVCSIAGALASCAMASHNRHVAKYLEAIRVWAVELAAATLPGPPRLRRPSSAEHVAEGADLLIAGTQQLLDVLNEAEVGLQDRLVAELTLYTRLLGRHDANTIHLVMQCVAKAVSSAAYQPGDPVTVPLRETAPFTRTSPLDDVMARGTA
jgi:hypothetical protein